MDLTFRMLLHTSSEVYKAVSYITISLCEKTSNKYGKPIPNMERTGRSDEHCKTKETLLIRDLQPALNENVGSEKLLLY